MTKEDTLKKVVMKVMKDDSINRNCDKWLVINVLKELGFLIKVEIDQVRHMPSFETLTRLRREIQNTDGELFADEEVQEMRDSKEDKIYSRYSHYNNPVMDTLNSMK